MKGIFTLVILFYLAGRLSAQITFQKTFGTQYTTIGTDIHQTRDGGFIIAGQAQYSFSGPSFDCLIRTNVLLDTLWTRTLISFAYSYVVPKVLQTYDGGFVMAGSTTAADPGDMYVIKVDSLGDTLWTKVFDAFIEDDFASIVQTADSGFILSGSVADSVGQYNAMLMRLNASGDILWSKCYGDTFGDVVSMARQTSDGGFIFTGGAGYDLSTRDYWLAKTDSIGNLSWSKVYGNHTWGTFNSGLDVLQTNDGGYILETDESLALIKTDSVGDTLWTKVFTVQSKSSSSIYQTADSGYILTGTDATPWGGEMYLLKLSPLGDLMWARDFGDSLFPDEGFSLDTTSDKGFVLVWKHSQFRRVAHQNVYCESGFFGK